MNCDNLDKFEEKHVISILMYVAGNPGCKKTDIYDAVSRNPRMPEKIEILESMGLMTHETINRSSFYKLTAGGNNIAKLLSAVSNEISNMDSAARSGNGATVAMSNGANRLHRQGGRRARSVDLRVQFSVSETYDTPRFRKEGRLGPEPLFDPQSLESFMSFSQRLSTSAW